MGMCIWYNRLAMKKEYKVEGGKVKLAAQELDPTVPAKEQRFIITVNRPTIRVHGKEYRRAHIAKATGISMSMISKVFSGQRFPGLRVCMRLASFFHVTVEELTAFIIPQEARKSDEQIDKMRNEIINGKRSLKLTYQGLVTGGAIKEKLTIERANSDRNRKYGAPNHEIQSQHSGDSTTAID